MSSGKYLSKIRRSYTIIDYYNDKLNELLWDWGKAMYDGKFLLILSLDCIAIRG